VLADEVLTATQAALDAGSSGAADFLVRAHVAEAPYLREIGSSEALVSKYLTLEKNMASTEAVSVEAVITRVVPEKVIAKTGEIITNTVETVFAPHAGMGPTNGRFDLGGAEGNRILYGVIGNDERALATAMEEARIGTKPFISNTMTFKSELV